MFVFLKFVHRKRSIWTQATEREMVFVEGSTAAQKQQKKKAKTIARKVANAFWRERSAKHGSILLRNNKLAPVSIGGSASLSNRTRRAEFILKETVVVVYVSADDLLLVSCVISIHVCIRAVWLSLFPYDRSWILTQITFYRMVARQAKQRILSLERPHFNRLVLTQSSIDVCTGEMCLVPMCSKTNGSNIGKTIVAQSRRSKHEKARYSAEGEQLIAGGDLDLFQRSLSRAEQLLVKEFRTYREWTQLLNEVSNFSGLKHAKFSAIFRGKVKGESYGTIL